MIIRIGHFSTNMKITLQKIIEWVLLVCIFSVIAMVLAIIAMNS